MSRRNLTKAALLAAAAVTLAACATTSLQSTWKNPESAPLNLKGKKVAALVVIDEEALRYAAEDEAAREIAAHGGVGVPAYKLLPQETLVYSLEQNKLVWASQSQTMNPPQVGSFVRELSKTLRTEMEKQGLL